MGYSYDKLALLLGPARTFPKFRTSDIKRRKKIRDKVVNWRAHEIFKSVHLNNFPLAHDGDAVGKETGVI